MINDNMKQKYLDMAGRVTKTYPTPSTSNFNGYNGSASQFNYKDILHANSYGGPNNGSNGSTSMTNGTSGSSVANSQYYEMAKKQEYASLLDKEIELENARSAALKHTNNQMAAQGFSSQGYGASYNSSMTGRYLNALGNAQNVYKANVDNLDYQQHQEEVANANDRFESITTMITQANDIDQVNSLLTDYGYGSMVENNGKMEFQWNEKPEGMSDDDWKQMRYYYNLQKSALDIDEYAAVYGDLDTWKSAYFVDGNGNAKKVGKEFKNESAVLWANINAGKYSYGTIIKMQNEDGEVIYVQWTKNGLKMSNEKAYNSSEKKDDMKPGVKADEEYPKKSDLFGLGVF